MRSRRVWIGGFDTEDDSNGNPTLFVLTHDKGSYWTRDRHQFLEHLIELKARAEHRKRRLELWATNLEYDLVNVFGSDRISEVTMRFGRSHLVTARWRGIEFRDTVRHVPASVGEWGQLLGLPKLRRPTSRHGAAWVRYATRDATITYRAAKTIETVYRSLGVAPRSTLAATAYALWSERTFKRTVYAIQPELRAFAKQAYYGGRTEAFALGTFRDVIGVDAASMFPWAMITRPLPIPWGAVRRVKHGDPITEHGIYKARIYSDLKIPVLPYRADEGLVYPNGRWIGTYAGPELLRFLECGGVASIIEGWEWCELGTPFNRYVSLLFRRKARSRGPLRVLYKLLLNALYGKFAQGGSRIMAVPLERFERQSYAPTVSRVWNGLVVYRVDGKPRHWSNVLWSALVTSRARARLHREISHAHASGARVLYCDTDGFLLTGGSVRYPLKARAPGDFERRGEYRRVIIVGKKEYGIETSPGTWELFAKGVPEPARRSYLEHGQASFRRPTRMLEALRTGLQANVWKERSKVRRVVYIHGGQRTDGTLLPPRVEDGSIQRGPGRRSNGAEHQGKDERGSGPNGARAERSSRG